MRWRIRSPRKLDNDPQRLAGLSWKLRPLRQRALEVRTQLPTDCGVSLEVTYVCPMIVGGVDPTSNTHASIRDLRNVRPSPLGGSRATRTRVRSPERHGPGGNDSISGVVWHGAIDAASPVQTALHDSNSPTPDRTASDHSRCLAASTGY